MAVEQEGSCIQTDELGRVGVFRRLYHLDVAAAQGLEFLGIETGAQQCVRKELEHQLLIASQELASDADRFGVGAGAEAATNPFYGVCEREGIALSGSFLQQACQ